MPNRFKLELRAPRLRTWLEQGLTQLVGHVRGHAWQADVERLEAGVQRFGDQAWRRIAARWPALAELVRERKSVRARYRAPTAPKVEPPLSPEAIAALIAQLNSGASWQARASAAMSLAHVEADEVVPALVQALRDPSAEVAVAAVDALASHHEPRSTETLLTVLANADGYFNPMTRVAAMAGLARRLRLDELAPVFAAVRDIDAEVSIAAVAVIGERAPAVARDHLLPILRNAQGYFLPLVRLAAANALERAGCLHGSLVQELLQSENDSAVRRVLERSQYLGSHDQAQLT
jgi:HEAT repeat protein